MLVYVSVRVIWMIPKSNFTMYCSLKSFEGKEKDKLFLWEYNSLNVEICVDMKNENNAFLT